MSSRDRLRRSRLALALTTSTLLTFASCRGGINAGEKGGIAFVAFAGMLLVMGVVLYFVLGRGE